MIIQWHVPSTKISETYKVGRLGVIVESTDGITFEKNGQRKNLPEGGLLSVSEGGRDRRYIRVNRSNEPK